MPIVANEMAAIKMLLAMKKRGMMAKKAKNVER